MVHLPSWPRHEGFALGLWLAVLPAAAATKPVVTTVPKFARFEVTLTSSVTYTNPLRDARLSGSFVSPLGETNRVEGFWNGGRTWLIRFAPDLPGNWTYTTACSDPANAGLDRQSGEFRCVAPLTKTPLDRHGPIRLARDRRHFEHADRTPFLWLGDVAWNGARLATPEDWQAYADVRAAQQFTVTQWRLAPGPDAPDETAIRSSHPRTINLDFFQHLDAKVETANRAGLVCAIAPLQELGDEEPTLPEDLAVDLLRHAQARWSAHAVVWILAVEADSLGRRVERWKRIGRQVFADRPHAPVILLPGETHWLLDEFRNESWLDALALPTTTPDDNGWQWLLAGPLATEWRKPPPRPILNLTPPPDASTDGDAARRALWQSLLSQPVAGASYHVAPVAAWETNLVSRPDMLPRVLPAWRAALFSAGMRNIAVAAEILRGVDFGALRPAPRVLKSQPGLESPRRHISAAGTESGNLLLVYVPEDRAVVLNRTALPARFTAAWVDARTGVQQAATPRLTAEGCSFETPAAADWLLVVTAVKP
jgi:hypothetical protein